MFLGPTENTVSEERCYRNIRQNTRKSGANVLRPNELKNSMQLFKLIARFLGNVYARFLYEMLQSHSGELI